MLNVREIEAMDKRRKELELKRKEHIASGACNNSENCEVCKGIRSALSEMDSIASEAGPRI